ncbi:MAG: SRPBCC family protein [Bacteroidota bacterium]
MVEVKTEIHIERAISDVWAYVAEPDHTAAWYVNIKSVEVLSPRPLGIGSQVAFSADFLGKRLTYTYVIKELKEGKKLVMEANEGPFPMETTYLLESIGETTTRMRLINQGTPKGFGRLMGPFVGAAMKRANQKDLALLKKILES